VKARRKLHRIDASIAAQPKTSCNSYAVHERAYCPDSSLFICEMEELADQTQRVNPGCERMVQSARTLHMIRQPCARFYIRLGDGIRYEPPRQARITGGQGIEQSTDLPPRPNRDGKRQGITPAVQQR
jgi:hypothetical protein